MAQPPAQGLAPAGGPTSERDVQRAIGVAFWLNFGFALIEFAGGWWTQSTAILANAVHDLGDSGAIAFGWWMQRLARRGATPGFSYGLGRLSLFAALVNGLILVAGSLWVLGQAIPRLAEPSMPHAPGMLGLAVLGLAVNGVAARQLMGGTTLNERVLNWHLLEDLLGWAAILIVAAALLVADWPILDPLLSIAFTALILVNVVRNLDRTARLFFQGSPDPALEREIAGRLRAIDHVVGIHHLHLWSLDGERHVLTAHLDLDEPITNAVQQRVKSRVAEVLAPYRLAHSTIEIEQVEEQCRDAS
ncbi:MAG: cation diffusion facilitator family transporter [Pseudomonadota bacterium]